jgi:hypothetical protein
LKSGRCRDTFFGKKARSASDGMISRTQGLSWFTQLLLTSSLHKNQSHNNQGNMEETSLNLIKHKKFLLALIFALLNSCLNKVTKVEVLHLCHEKHPIRAFHSSTLVRVPTLWSLPPPACPGSLHQFVECNSGATVGEPKCLSDG